MAEVSYLNYTNQDTAQPSGGESSSFIWLVLFMGIIILSLLLNTSLFVGVAFGRKMNRMFVFLLLFFIINLVEYILLVFEFSLGPTSHYPYSEQSCTFYQVLLQFLPLLSPWCLVLFVCHAYSAVHIPPPRFPPLCLPPHISHVAPLHPLLPLLWPSSLPQWSSLLCDGPGWCGLLGRDAHGEAADGHRPVLPHVQAHPHLLDTHLFSHSHDGKDG